MRKLCGHFSFFTLSAEVISGQDATRLPRLPHADRPLDLQGRFLRHSAFLRRRAGAERDKLTEISMATNEGSVSGTVYISDKNEQGDAGIRKAP